MVLVRLLTFILLLILLLAINCVQLGSLLILPWSQNKFRSFNAKCGAFWWSCLTLNLEYVCNVQVEIIQIPNENYRGLSSAEKAIVDSNVLILSNHQSLIDPLIILIVTQRLGGLSYLKWFVKDSLIYVPFLGWGLWLLDSIFLKRNWNQDESSIASHFKKILKTKNPIWLVSYPEGTRRSDKNILSSKKYALQTHREPYRNVLVPRYKGFVGNIQGIGNRLDSIYDFTIAYSIPNCGLRHLLRGNLGKVKVYFEIIPRQTLPQSNLLLKEWIFSQFRKKDEILETLEP